MWPRAKRCGTISHRHCLNVAEAEKRAPSGQSWQSWTSNWPQAFEYLPAGHLAVHLFVVRPSEAP